jgi:hypothetical protein
MLNVVECRYCGTLYSIKGQEASFTCHNCKRKISTASLTKASRLRSEEQVRKVQNRLARAIFLIGSTVGLFVLLMMVPTAIYLKASAIVFPLMIFELVFGSLLVCISISLYLLSIQVFSLQSSVVLLQHNVTIFHDQIIKVFGLIKKKK